MIRVRKVTIFRYTNPGDDITNPAFADKVVFNADQDVKVENAFIHGMDIKVGRDISQNPIVNNDLAEHQDSGLGDLLYVLEGTISQRDGGSANGINAKVAILSIWADEPSENTNFPQGRFGIKIEDFAVYSLTPTSNTGLYLIFLNWKLDMEMDNPAPFTMQLSKSKLV